MRLCDYCGKEYAEIDFDKCECGREMCYACMDQHVLDCEGKSEEEK